jgi:hypothetical protein
MNFTGKEWYLPKDLMAKLATEKEWCWAVFTLKTLHLCSHVVVGETGKADCTVVTAGRQITVTHLHPGRWPFPCEWDRRVLSVQVRVVDPEGSPDILAGCWTMNMDLLNKQFKTNKWPGGRTVIPTGAGVSRVWPTYREQESSECCQVSFQLQLFIYKTNKQNKIKKYLFI